LARMASSNVSPAGIGVAGTVHAPIRSAGNS
jgi:hypothetical protein